MANTTTNKPVSGGGSASLDLSDDLIESIKLNRYVMTLSIVNTVLLVLNLMLGFVLIYTVYASSRRIKRFVKNYLRFYSQVLNPPADSALDSIEIGMLGSGGNNGARSTTTSSTTSSNSGGGSGDNDRNYSGSESVSHTIERSMHNHNNGVKKSVAIISRPSSTSNVAMTSLSSTPLTTVTSNRLSGSHLRAPTSSSVAIPRIRSKPPAMTELSLLPPTTIMATTVEPTTSSTAAAAAAAVNGSHRRGGAGVNSSRVEREASCESLKLKMKRSESWDAKNKVYSNSSYLSVAEKRNGATYNFDF